MWTARRAPAGLRCFIGRKSRWFLRVDLRQACARDWCEGKVFAVPGLDFSQRDGAGGLQAMVKCGLPIRGKRMIVAGTGPLLLAVAAYLREHGAEIPMICEQASRGTRLGLALSCLAGRKIVQGSPT